MAAAAIDEIPVVPPEEAIAFFRGKGFAFGFAWQDVWQAEHARAFTVAKAMSRDILEDIRAAVDAAIAEGTTFDSFKKQLQPILEAKGWWGRKRMIDPLTMEARTVQLGSPRRLKTIFNVNMRVAYETGKWERIARQAKAFPFLRYTSVMDGRERPQHHAWHGTILPINDPWWETHSPPCGWNCRCTVIAYNQRQLDRRGLAITENPISFPRREWRNKRTGEIHSIEDGIDPGWSYHVGRAPLEGLSPPPLGNAIGPADGPATASRAPDVVARFRSAFGLRGDGVFTDADGWPLAISASWLRGLSVDDQERAVIAAPAIADPDSIRLVWVRDRDGRMNLFRRYQCGPLVADVGGIGWRFALRVRQALAGDAIWTRGQLATASAGRTYHRDRLGRFASHGAYIDHALASPGSTVKALAIGDITERTVHHFVSAGLAVSKRTVHLEHGRVRHILSGHGIPREHLRGQVPVGRAELLRAHTILSAAHHVAPGKKRLLGRQDNPRFEAVTHEAGSTITTIGEVRRRGLTIISMWKRLRT